MSPRARLAWLWTVVILALCWWPRAYMGFEEEGRRPFLNIPHLDKLVHAGIFAVFAFLWMKVGTSSRKVAWVFAAGLALTVISELGQELPIVNRDATPGDVAADTLGVVLGLVAYKWLENRSEKRAARPTA